MISPIRR